MRAGDKIILVHAASYESTRHYASETDGRYFPGATGVIVSNYGAPTWVAVAFDMDGGAPIKIRNIACVMLRVVSPLEQLAECTESAE